MQATSIACGAHHTAALLIQSADDSALDKAPPRHSLYTFGRGKQSTMSTPATGVLARAYSSPNLRACLSGLDQSNALAGAYVRTLPDPCAVLACILPDRLPWPARQQLLRHATDSITRVFGLQIAAGERHACMPACQCPYNHLACAPLLAAGSLARRTDSQALSGY